MNENSYIEERVDNLDDIVKNCVISTEKAIRSVTRTVNQLSYEMRAFKENIGKFIQLFPEYKDKKLVSIFASLRFDEKFVSH